VKRILEDDGSGDPRVEVAARLLRHMPPIADDMQRQRRVRARLRARAPLATFQWRHSLMAAVLLVAGVAGARVVENGGVRRTREQAAAWLHDHVARSAPRTRDTKPAVSSRPTSAPVSALEAASAEPAPPVAVAPPEPNKPAPAKSRTARALKSSGVELAQASRAAAVPALVPSGPGAELVVAAMQARSAGDLPKAERLLSEYRSRFSGGALDEEALALSIEAAALRGSARAPELARSYLARFPHGRYRKWVEQTLHVTAP
jgi:hypothetical protein